MYSALLPVLFAFVTLRSGVECKRALKSWDKRPEVTRHIRKLAIRPNHPVWDTHEKLLDESWVAQMISQIALADNLRALQKFVWDGLEMPPDYLWWVLRLS